MLLEYSLKKSEAAKLIEDAVIKVLEKGIRTKDIWTSECRLVGTKEMGDLILEEI